MPGKQVGKIAIRAIPDVTGFRAELRTKLAGLTNVDVEVKVRLSKDSLAGARGQIKLLEKDINLNVRLKNLNTDAALARRDFALKLKKILENTPVYVKVDLDLTDAKVAKVREKVTALVDDLAGRPIRLTAELDRKTTDDIKRQMDLAAGKELFAGINERMAEATRKRIAEAREQLLQWTRRQNLVTQIAVQVGQESYQAAEHKLRDFHSKWNKMNIIFETGVNALLASQHLRWITRPRTIDLFVRVNKASLAGVATTLAALSGGRLVGNIAKDYWDFFKDLDKNLPSLTLMTTGIIGLTGSLFGAVSSLVSFGAGLAAIMPLFLVLPGLIFGTVAALGTMIVAWRDVGTQLEPLKDDMTELGDIMSSSYWSEARQPIIDLIQNLMPQMRRSFQGVGAAMGGFTGALADAFGVEFADGRFESIFATMEEGFRILQGGASGFAGAVVNLAQIAGRYFPRLAGWIVRVADRFDNWLTAISTDGRLDTWINDGVVALYALWDGLMAGGQILKGLWTAAEDAGATGMLGFRDQMQAWEQMVNSPSSQRALTDWFEGGREAAEGLGDAVEAIFGGLKDTSPIVQEVFTEAGDSMRELGELVGDIFGNETFMSGVREMLEGVTEAFETLRPAMEPVGDFLGTAATAVGDFAAALAGPLGAAAQTILPPLEEVLRDLTPLVEGLAAALERTLASSDFQALVGGVGDALGAVIGGFEASLPNVNLLLERTVDLLGLVLPGLEGMSDSPNALAFAISSFIGWASLLPMILQGIFLLGQGLIVTLDTGVRMVKAAVTVVVQTVGTALMWLSRAIADVFEGIRTWDFASIGENLTDLNIEYGQIFEGLGEAADAEGALAAQQFTDAWAQYGDFDRGFIAAQDALAAQAEHYHATGEILGAEAVNGMGVGVADTAPGMGANAVAALQSGLSTTATDPASWLYTDGTIVAGGLGSGIAGAAPNVGTEAFAALHGGLIGASATYPGMWLYGDGTLVAQGLGQGVAGAAPGAGATAVGSLYNAVVTSGSDPSSWLNADGTRVAGGFASGVTAGAPGVSTATDALPSAAVQAVSGANTLLTPQGGQMAQGLATGIQNGQSGVRTAGGLLNQAAHSQLVGMYGSGQSVGADLGRGMANGIAGQIGNIAAAARRAVVGATVAAQNQAQIYSPSKLWEKEIGAQLVAGGARGIDKNAYKMRRAAENAMPTPELSFLGQAIGNGNGGGGPLVGELTFVTSGNVRTDMQEVMWELNRLQMGGR